MNKEFENNKCYLCESEDIVKTEYQVRDNLDLKVLNCKKCSLSFLSSFNHIDENFYEDGQMHAYAGDFNLENWLENSYVDDFRRFNFLMSKIKNKSVLDFGCGAGGFLRLINGFSKAFGVEKQACLKDFFEKENLVVFDDILKFEKQKFDIITLFHVLEHFKNPVEELQKISRYLADNGEIIIEVPSSNDALLKLFNNKPFADFTHWSCHLFYFNQLTLKKLADKANLKINYIKNVQRYSLMNHLYWLIKGKPAGHKVWKAFDFKLINFLYKNLLKLFNLNDTIVISLSKY